MKRSRSGLRHAGERGGKALDGVIVCCTGVTSILKVCADDISGQVLRPRVTVCMVG